MGISEEDRTYIKDQIEYYIGEAQSYRQIAESYSPEIGSPTDAAFGIIAGCVYSAFIQAYAGRQKSPALEDIQEFHAMLKEHAASIREALAEDGNTG